MVFYNPFNMELKGVPTIVYPSEVEDAFDRRDRGCVERHLVALVDWHGDLITPDTNYIISIPWANQGDRMVDFWLNQKLGEYEFGPLVDQRTYRGMERDTNSGVACGNALVLLGREEEVRVLVMNTWERSLEEYISGRRAVLPQGLMKNQNFYLD